MNKEQSSIPSSQLEIDLIDNQFYKKIFFEVTNDFVFLHEFDSDNKAACFMQVNQTACERLGYSLEEMKKMRPVDIVTDQDLAPIPNEREKLAQDENLVFEKTFITKEAKLIPVEIHSRIFYHNNKRMVISIGRDITHRKKMEQELIHAKNMAEESSDLKNQFLRNVSHELRTPLNGILGILLLTEEYVQQFNDPKLNTNLENIEYYSKNLLNLVNELLDFSESYQKKQVLVLKNINLHKLINDLILLFQPKLNEKKLHLELKINPNLPAMLHGDPIKFQQILFNLIDNAIKFSHQGTILITIELLKNHRNKIDLRIIIEDSGIGIEQEKIPCIFEPFYQIDGDYTKKYQGIGLGLSVVKNLVDLMKGKIKIESKLDVGTRCIVVLPFEKSLISEKKDNKNRKDTATSSKELKILMVEDDKINREYLSTLLTVKGYSVTAAKNGQEALNMIDRERFDLILMDLGMPVMDGITTTQHIRKNRNPEIQNLPIIVVSAHVFETDKIKADEAGADDFIKKPVNVDLLLEKINCLTKDRIK